MDNTDNAVYDKLLADAGVEDVSTLSYDAKRSLAKTLQASAILDEEKKKPSNLRPKKSFSSGPSQQVNSNTSVIEKDVSKPPVPNQLNYASVVASQAGSNRSPKLENKPGVCAAGAGRDNGTNSNNTYYNSNTTTDNVCVDSCETLNENNVSSPDQPSQSKPEGEGDSEAKDNVNNSVNNIKDRDSPEIVEEEVRRPLMQLVIEKLPVHTTSNCADNLLPPLSLPKDEWLKQAGEIYLKKKVNRIRDEARQAKWVTISEKNISVASLESAVRRSSPTHTKDEGAAGLTDHRNMDIEKSPKARKSPDNIDNDGRESSPDFSVVENSPNAKREAIASEADDSNSQAISLPDSKNCGRTDTPQNSPQGRSMDDSNITADSEQGRKKGNRRSRRVRGANNRTDFSNSSSYYTDETANNSYGQSPSPSERNFEREYNHNNANYPSLGSSSTSENNAQEKECPMCQKHFPAVTIERHAWDCTGTAEEENEVAESYINGDDSDTTETESSKPRNIFLDGNQYDDDDDFVIKQPKPSSAKKRSLCLSEDEERPVKNSRK